MMLRKQQVIKEYGMWNMVTAMRRLASIRFPEKIVHDRKRAFIARLHREIIDAVRQVNDILKANERYHGQLAAVDIAVIAERYRLAHSHAKASAVKLTLTINEELALYYKSEYFFDKAENEPYKRYEDLLNYVLTCCVGIANNHYTLQAADSEDSVGFFYNTVTSIYKAADVLYGFAAASGGWFAPSSQDLDPLLGSTHTTENKYDMDLGQCYGHTMNWAQQLADSGIVEKINLFDEFTYLSQKQQQKNQKFDIKSARNTAHQILQNLDYTGIFHIGIYREGGGHALGIRRIPGSGKIHFFDANLGEFVLGNDDKFVEFFQLYLSVMCLSNAKYYTHMSIERIADQDIDKANDGGGKAVVNLPAMNALTSLPAYIALFTATQEKFAGGYFNKIRLHHLKSAFVENMLVRIKCTTNPQVLTTLFDVLSLPVAELNKEEYDNYAFLRVLHGKKNPVLDSFRFNAATHVADSISQLKIAIQNQITDLEYKRSLQQRNPHSPRHIQ